MTTTKASPTSPPRQSAKNAQYAFNKIGHNQPSAKRNKKRPTHTARNHRHASTSQKKPPVRRRPLVGWSRHRERSEIVDFTFQAAANPGSADVHVGHPLCFSVPYRWSTTSHFGPGRISRTGHNPRGLAGGAGTRFPSAAAPAPGSTPEPPRSRPAANWSPSRKPARCWPSSA